MASIPFNAAANAYASAAKLISGGGRPDAAAGALGGGQGPDFAKMLSQHVEGVVAQGKASEAVALDMVNGQANVVDMVTAISQTELAIETMVTVRDRVISAYEEIMRMPI